jgi:hypothetical protein
LVGKLVECLADVDWQIHFDADVSGSNALTGASWAFAARLGQLGLARQAIKRGDVWTMVRRHHLNELHVMSRHTEAQLGLPGPGHDRLPFFNLPHSKVDQTSYQKGWIWTHSAFAIGESFDEVWLDHYVRTE